jgi:uncharacterized protein with ATP-grasp and redox domains
MENKEIQVPLAIECSSCMIDNLGTLVPLLTDNIEKQFDLYKLTYELLAKGFKKRLDPATLSIDIYRKLYTKCNAHDPYRIIKSDSIEAAKKALPIVEKAISNQAGFQKLRLALAAAITGNVLDFNTAGHNPNLDELGKTFDEIVRQGFAIDHSDLLWDTLNASNGKIVFLADNAGETLFDIPLVRLVTEIGWKGIYVVKDQPIINDAVLEDVQNTEIKNLAELVTTGAWAFGTPRNDVSKEFLELIQSSDIVISKGQANIETFPEIQRELQVETYFVLRSKCKHIASRLGVKKGDNVVIRRP